MAKNVGGRPSKYDPKLCDAIISYFSGPRTEQRVKSVTTGKNEYEKTEYEIVALPLPTLTKFARSIHVNKDTVIQWTKVHTEFSDAYKDAKELQKEFLVDNGLEGFYPPSSFIFTAKNITDMRDKTEVEHSGAMTIGHILNTLNGEKRQSKAIAGQSVETQQLIQNQD